MSSLILKTEVAFYLETLVFKCLNGGYRNQETDTTNPHRPGALLTHNLHDTGLALRRHTAKYQLSLKEC
jgi:hypothetical protein